MLGDFFQISAHSRLESRLWGFVFRMFELEDVGLRLWRFLLEDRCLPRIPIPPLGSRPRHDPAHGCSSILVLRWGCLGLEGGVSVALP